MHLLDDDLGLVPKKDTLENLAVIYWSTILVDCSIGTYSKAFFAKTQYSRRFQTLDFHRGLIALNFDSGTLLLLQ